jgi:hypothetical protein
MEMDMEDALSRSFIGITQVVVTCGIQYGIVMVRQRSGDIVHLGKEIRRTVHQILVVLLWDDQGMTFGNRVDIQESQDVIILVNRCRWDFVLSDLTEQAHGVLPH